MGRCRGNARSPAPPPRAGCGGCWRHPECGAPANPRPQAHGVARPRPAQNLPESRKTDRRPATAAPPRANVALNRAASRSAASAPRGQVFGLHPLWPGQTQPDRIAPALGRAGRRPVQNGDVVKAHVCGFALPGNALAKAEAKGFHVNALHSGSAEMITLSVFLTGLGVGLGLILAIGAQNAFVLRQGLRGEHVLAVVLACAISDAALIVLGVTSFARIALVLPWLDPVMRYAGAAFLGWYGWRAAVSAFRSTEALVVAGGAEAAPLGRVLATCLALTWLEPACVSGYGGAVGHHLDPVSGCGIQLWGRGRHGVVPVLFQPWIWRAPAAPLVCQPARVAGAGRADRAGDVGHRAEAGLDGVIPSQIAGPE